MSRLFPKRLFDQQLIVTTSPVRAVTNPAGLTTTILSVKVRNTGSNNVTVSLFRLPDAGGTVGVIVPNEHEFSNIILYASSQFGSKNSYENRIILEDENDSFWIQVSEANVVNCSIDGLQTS